LNPPIGDVRVGLTSFVDLDTPTSIKMTQIKKSEARAMIFIAHGPTEKLYARGISNKLKMDYAYLLQILSAMKNKGWIQANRSESGKVFYNIRKDSKILKEAVKIHSKI